LAISVRSLKNLVFIHFSLNEGSPQSSSGLRMTVRMISNREGGVVRGTGAGGTNGLAEAAWLFLCKGRHLERTCSSPYMHSETHNSMARRFGFHRPDAYSADHSNCGDSPPHFPEFPPG
jgi:hypothetical protein